jgi:hypothetical protein
MTATDQPDYRIRPSTPAPASYPAHPAPDSYSPTPFLADFESRRRAFLEHILRNPAPENTKSAWFELARLAAGGTPHVGIFYAALDFIDARKDCSDFVMHSILRLLYQFPHSSAPLTGAEGAEKLLWRARQSVLGFK